MCSHVHVSNIYNSQHMESAEVSINRRVDRKAVAHVYNGILLGHKKNEILPFSTTWMDLEGITLSEISQAKTNTI